MKYSDCISITMAALNYMLENGWSLSNNTNLNSIILKLNDSGFVLDEESRFDTDLTYGTNQVCVSPSYVLSMLFDGGYDDYETKKGHFITSVAKQLPDSQAKNQVSFIELVKLIDAMRSNFDTGKMSPSMVDMNYIRFRQMLNKVKRDEYVTLKNQVLGLSNLDYDTLTNIRNAKPGTARKIERMYQVEVLLEKYCKIKVLEEQGKIDVDYDEYLDYSDMLDDVDLSKHTISWNDFCDNVKSSNNEEMIATTEYWQRNKHWYYNVKLTALGLDEMVLPGTPKVHKRHM